MRALFLATLLCGCGHVASGRTHATARLASLTVTGASRGELKLLARYQLDGLPYGAWRGEQTALSLSLNDVPFASIVAEPRVLPGDQVEVPLGLVFTRAPREVAAMWSVGAPIRVRLRGRMTLVAGDAEERIPTDVEGKLELPASALPPSRT